jgi:hypothetical protein
MATKIINVGRDFSQTPGGRSKDKGPASGEEFRQRLVDILESGDRVVVELDGTEGYGSSFLEEAFGGLVRLQRWSYSELKNSVQVRAIDPSYQMYADRALHYMEDASKRLNA